MDQDFDPGNKYSVPYLAGTDAIVVNTATVENVPTSWADLWKPEYAGRMVFLDDSRPIIGMTLVTLGYDPNTTDPAQLEEAKAKLAELIPSVKVFDSDSPKTALIAGDVIWVSFGQVKLSLRIRKIRIFNTSIRAKVLCCGRITG